LDNRKQQRYSVGFDVVLCYEGLGLVRGKAVDMSANGLLVETACASIPKGAEVNAAFVCTARGRPRHISLQGVVVRSTEQGVAIEFSDAAAAECANILAQFAVPRLFSGVAVPQFA
jgi:hypothetical protein